MRGVERRGGAPDGKEAVVTMVYEREIVRERLNVWTDETQGWR